MACILSNLSNANKKSLFYFKGECQNFWTIWKRYLSFWVENTYSENTTSINFQIITISYNG